MATENTREVSKLFLVVRDRRNGSAVTSGLLTPVRGLATLCWTCTTILGSGRWLWCVSVFWFS